MRWRRRPARRRGRSISTTVPSADTSTSGSAPATNAPDACARATSSRAAACTSGARTSSARTTTACAFPSSGKCVRRLSYVRMIGIERGRSSSPSRRVFMVRVGRARTTSAPPASTSATTGRSRTRRSTKAQARLSRSARQKRPSSGMRGRSTQSPSSERAAGRATRLPSTAAATTRMVPIAKPSKIVLPERNMPDMAAMTVRPLIATARPEVEAAAVRIASRFSAPRARSSRARRR